MSLWAAKTITLTRVAYWQGVFEYVWAHLGRGNNHIKLLRQHRRQQKRLRYHSLSMIVAACTSKCSSFPATTAVWPSQPRATTSFRSYQPRVVHTAWKTSRQSQRRSNHCLWVHPSGNMKRLVLPSAHLFIWFQYVPAKQELLVTAGQTHTLQLHNLTLYDLGVLFKEHKAGTPKCSPRLSNSLSNLIKREASGWTARQTFSQSRHGSSRYLWVYPLRSTRAGIMTHYKKGPVNLLRMDFLKRTPLTTARTVSVMCLPWTKWTTKSILWPSVKLLKNRKTIQNTKSISKVWKIKYAWWPWMMF